VSYTHGIGERSPAQRLQGGCPPTDPLLFPHSLSRCRRTSCSARSWVFPRSQDQPGRRSPSFHLVKSTGSPAAFRPPVVLPPLFPLSASGPFLYDFLFPWVQAFRGSLSTYEGPLEPVCSFSDIGLSPSRLIVLPPPEAVPCYRSRSPLIDFALCRPTFLRRLSPRICQRFLDALLNDIYRSGFAGGVLWVVGRRIPSFFPLFQTISPALLFGRSAHRSRSIRYFPRLLFLPFFLEISPASRQAFFSIISDWIFRKWIFGLRVSLIAHCSTTSPPFPATTPDLYIIAQVEQLGGPPSPPFVPLSSLRFLETPFPSPFPLSFRSPLVSRSTPPRPSTRPNYAEMETSHKYYIYSFLPPRRGDLFVMVDVPL